MLELPALGPGAPWNFPPRLSKRCSLAAPGARLRKWNVTHQISAENFLQINESNQWQGSAPRQPVHKARLSAFKLTVKPDIPLRRARRGSWHKAGQCTHRWTCCSPLVPKEILACSSVLFNLVPCKVQSTHHLCIQGQSQIVALFPVRNTSIAPLNVLSSS